jgi:energy-coupling factor transporter ATP-binding protein EcfA2
MFNLKKVNNIVIEPTKKTKKPIHSSIFKNENNITLLASKKGSGKTTALKTIIVDTISHYKPIKDKIILDKHSIRILDDNNNNQQHSYRNLSVFIFCGNANNDITWDEIKDILHKSKLLKISINLGTYIIEGKKVINLVYELINYLKDNKSNGDNLIIFDDLALELRNNKAIVQLFKNMRHLNIINIICSSQSVIDFTRDMLDNSDYILLFKKLPDDRLDHLYKWLSLDITKPLFNSLYDIATSDDKHSIKNFLMIDKNNDTYYKGFNYMFNLVTYDDNDNDGYYKGFDYMPDLVI